MASDEAWRAAHVRARRPTEIAGWTSLASGALALLPVSMPVVLVGVSIGTAVLLGCTLHGALAGGQAAREALARSLGSERPEAG